MDRKADSGFRGRADYIASPLKERSQMAEGTSGGMNYRAFLAELVDAFADGAQDSSANALSSTARASTMAPMSALTAWMAR